MRVTENTNFGVARDSVRKSRERMEALQLQNATLKKMNTPSDDPIGSAKVLEIRTDKMNNEQFLSNIRLAETFLSNSDHALGELAEIVVRAKEIALGQASGASSNEDTRLGLSEEVSQLFLQGVAAANRRIGERYLFGGYKTNQPPVSNEGRFQGDDGQMMAEVSKDVFVAMNVPGLEVFNTNPKGALADHETMSRASGRAPALQSEVMPGRSDGENINFFDELQTLRIGLLTGDLDAIRATLERFDSMHARIIASRAKVGSRIQGLQTSQGALERHTLTNAALSSTIEDADMAQVVSDLAREETIFRSSLASSQKLIQPTLMDFLR
jgi:flagellar hook-associated protein 3 FlgL